MLPSRALRAQLHALRQHAGRRSLDDDLAAGSGHLGGGIFNQTGTLTLVNATREQNIAGSGVFGFAGGSVFVPGPCL